jgi:hypothetical protein
MRATSREGLNAMEMQRFDLYEDREQAQRVANANGFLHGGARLSSTLPRQGRDFDVNRDARPRPHDDRSRN